MRLLCDGIGYFVFMFLLSFAADTFFPERFFGPNDMLDSFSVFNYVFSLLIGVVLGFWLDLSFRTFKRLR